MMTVVMVGLLKVLEERSDGAWKVLEERNDGAWKVLEAVDDDGEDLGKKEGVVMVLIVVKM